MAVLLLTTACLSLTAVVVVLLVTRRPGDAGVGARIDGLGRNLERVEQGLREELRGARRDTAEGLKRATDSLVTAQSALGDAQARQLQVFAGQLDALRSAVETRVEALRTSVAQCLRDLQQDTASKLDSMRRVVDEQLETTLEKRLGESFRQVSERLEQVYRGLGEMQVLATGVGDLKRVLANVKTRGTWGEVQLASLLEQVLARDQYAQNVATNRTSGERVEFAIRLPGRNGGCDEPTWLPIDAKFPLEDYQSLLDASERSDTAAMEEAGRRLEVRIKACAKDVSTKYINPPETTDFAIMFLPNEGLYAEVLRRPGLIDVLQREHRVVVSGPMTLWAVLNSLQMGFRTLAIQHRSSEVWSLLGAVKSEFGKFGVVLDGIQKNLHRAATKIDEARKGTRTIERKLTGVQELPAHDAAVLLGGIVIDAQESEESLVG